MAKKDKGKIQIRNSTTDFLVFTKENGGDGVDVLLADDNVWLTQGGIASPRLMIRPKATSQSI